MRRVWTAAILVLMSSGPAMAGSKAWKVAKKAGTSEAYRQFARENPTDPKRAEALTRVEALDWQRAVTRDSAEAWGSFVAFHPGSARIGEARSRLEAARWKAAIDENSRQAFELYLASHGSGPHAAEARERLDAIAWEEANREGSVDSFSRYLVRYPDSFHAAEARQKREELIWQEAKRQDDPMAYRRYLVKFPQGMHADQARAAVEGFRFRGVAIKLVVNRVVRGDSLDTWRARLSSTLDPGLKALGFEVVWLDIVDGRGRVVDPFADLLVEVPEDHAALVVTLEEERGRSFAPSGHATDVVAKVEVVPPARARAFIHRDVKASTGKRVFGVGEHQLHLDAQEQLGRAILAAGLELEDWKR